jgi:hypothetical protein
MAWRYEMEREETLVAQALATSSVMFVSISFAEPDLGARQALTGSVVEGIEEGEKGANGKDVRIVVKHLV